MTTNHPAHGPVSLDRLHQIREILSNASAQSDGGNLGYAMADAVKVIDWAIAAFGVDNKTTHNSVIAEQLAHILSVMEVTDHQRAIISCAVDRLNKNADTICQLSKAACSSPDSLDYQGAKELFNYLMTEEETNATVNGWNACRDAMLQAGTFIDDGTIPVTQIKPVADLYAVTSPTGSETSFTFDAVEARGFIGGGWTVQEYVELERYQKAVAGNSPVTPDKSTCKYCGGTGYFRWQQSYECMPCPCKGCTEFAAPQQEVKSALENGMQRYAGAMQKLSEGDK
ncbi:MAG: hypothetical protein RSE65_20685 [Hafnia sp.]